ncbi:3-oxo-tetronate kinase [Brucella pseudogrignonensis]|uniref:3-oxo-tetronate kinase n=1 Tax=Brucella pseudogrignonensis TaxID=419475 RepID=A0ABU1MDS1_9HYPH|nr:3-oxo-tetronate kinase [Brucella pseudogrignonensis]MDR6434192.1 uncharacterized protein YgbK (DUF1537 family) [Brucella pseudogrignonensis]
MTVLGCIADDFTGATDIASLLARSGYRVRLHAGLPTGEPDGEGADFEVIALKCRTSPVSEAIKETSAAFDWLHRRGAKRFFWKYCSSFDSTAQGNIGPVAEMLMAKTGVRQTIYCPAFPDNGRRVFMGNLFLNETPLAESSMKDHPLTPMRDSNVMRLLAPQVAGAIGLISLPDIAMGAQAVRARLAALKEQGVAHIVIDAVSNDDLQKVAAACCDMELLTGGSALTLALPELYLQSGLLAENAEKRSSPSLGLKAIILAGSVSAMTNLQVAEYLKAGGPALKLDPLRLATDGYDYAVEWLASQDLTRAPIVYTTTEPERVKQIQVKLGVERAGQLVEVALAACALAARNLGVQRFVVAGGETSGAVTKALKVKEMDVGPEISPGVPWCFCLSDKTQIALTLKSGNFGAPTFFRDAFQRLESL